MRDVSILIPNLAGNPVSEFAVPMTMTEGAKTFHLVAQLSFCQTLFLLTLHYAGFRLRTYSWLVLISFSEMAGRRVEASQIVRDRSAQMGLVNH